ncbi:MAG TPA: hypothetical protein VLG92_00410 [Candidatus Saccharimonadia bacterium]|nr:hypothetical protein [Candidatus Saccharimonadia bacterium]
MAKEDKYILWAIVLPVLAVVAILLDVPKHVPQAVAFIGFLVLLLPPAVLIYLAKKEAFRPTPKLKADQTRKVSVVEVAYKTKVRKLAIGMRIAGAPLLIIGWQIVRNTTRTWYYVAAGLLLLLGTVLIGVSVGLMKVANE